MMQKVDLEKYKRRRLYEAFKDREIPYFAVTANIEITHLKDFIAEKGYGFFVAISFLISKSVNLIPELRHRIINGELFEFESVDPGYTVLLEDETFSFCDSRHFESFAEYREYAVARIKEVKHCPDQDTGDKHHMFFITNLPWFTFTSIVHPYYSRYASIPIVSIGKYFNEGQALSVPIGIQVHHALADGIHVGKFYTYLSDMCRRPAECLGSVPPNFDVRRGAGYHSFE